MHCQIEIDIETDKNCQRSLEITRGRDRYAEKKGQIEIEMPNIARN